MEKTSSSMISYVNDIELKRFPVGEYRLESGEFSFRAIWVLSQHGSSEILETWIKG